MPTKTIKVKGMPELLRKLAKLPRVVDRAARRSVEAETHEVAQDMRRSAPVKTGALREGIQAEFDAKTIRGKAVSTAEYSKYVVHGTDDTPANDFITPAAEVSRRRFPRRVRIVVKEELTTL